MEKELKKIGIRIKKHRKIAGLTSMELAARATLTQSFVSQVENGLVPGVSVDTILRIAQALDIPVSLLLDEDLSEETRKAMDFVRSMIVAESKAKYKKTKKEE